MLTCSILESFKIWEELVTAYHSLNGFGGDTAEIYSYRLEPYTPSAHSTHNEAKIREVSIQAAKSLKDILEEFQQTHECDIFVDEIKLSKWSKAIEENMRHRYHVRIERDK